MREKLLIKLAGWHAEYPGRMLMMVFLLTLLCGGIAGNLKITMRWSDLLPTKDRRTLQFNKIIDEFVSATSLVVVVQGEEQKIKAFADRLAPCIPDLIDGPLNESLKKRISKLEVRLARRKDRKGPDADTAGLESEIRSLKADLNRPLFRRVDYKTEVDFLREHGLMLVKEDDLENIREVFTDPNLTGLLSHLNSAMEKEYVQREESLSTREKEDGAVAFLDGLDGLLGGLERSVLGEPLSEGGIRAIADKILFGEPYLLSYDEKALILNAVPNFTMMDTEKMVNGTAAVQNLLDEIAVDFPDVRAGLTGFIAVGHDEMVYAEKSLGTTTVIAVVAILALLVLAFRMWVAPLLAILNLLVGLVWAVAVVTLVVGQLNIMTQMMAVILLGLGIDFAIHIISAFSERRAGGMTIEEAMRQTFVKSGKGILTGGLTTVSAFLTLVISHSRGMKEMGLVMGFGLLAVLLVTFLFLPAMLVARERRQLKKGKIPAEPRDLSFRFLGGTAERLGRRWVYTLLAGLAVTVLLVGTASRITFDHNYMNIEPEGLTSVNLQDTVLEKFDLGMDYAMILTESAERSREMAAESRDLGSVALTDDISSYLPSPAQQESRRLFIREIQDRLRSTPPRAAVPAFEISGLAAEIERLGINVMEMQDMAFLGGQDKVDVKCRLLVGDPDRPSSTQRIKRFLDGIAKDPERAALGFSRFQKAFAPYFHETALRMSSMDSIRMEDLPDSILDRYTNAGRDLFLVTAFPAGNVWKDAQFLEKFVKDLERVSNDTTGMPPVFRALVEIIGRDGRNAMLLTLLIVFLLLWADFRNFRHALMAMIPLALGMFWMLGLMNLVGMQLTVMNVMGLPMILGIGIDDGVHIVHRWREEGRGRLHAIFSSTGKAILLTSLTTMLGFGSLVFSIYRGFGHLGGALFLGVAACFLTTVIFLSGLIGGTERKKSTV